MGTEFQTSLLGAAAAAVAGPGQQGRDRGDKAQRGLCGAGGGGERAVGARESRDGWGVAVVAKHRMAGKAAGGHLALGRLKVGQQNKTEAAYGPR